MQDYSILPKKLLKEYKLNMELVASLSVVNLIQQAHACAYFSISVLLFFGGLYNIVY